MYLLVSDSLIRIPKSGTPATQVNEPAARVMSATMLGANLYWLETLQGGINGCGLPKVLQTLKSAPSLGGSASTIATFRFPVSSPATWFAVTSSTVFFISPFTGLYDFPISGLPASGFTMVAASATCMPVTSDTDAIYCAQTDGSDLAIAGDGTTTPLGSAISSSYIVFDDTYAYWADMTSVGSIMKAPKAGGGTATVLARDTSPTAIAVDANSVYWSDEGGYIKSVPK